MASSSCGSLTHGPSASSSSASAPPARGRRGGGATARDGGGGGGGGGRGGGSRGGAARRRSGSNSNSGSVSTSVSVSGSDSAEVEVEREDDSEGTDARSREDGERDVGARPSRPLSTPPSAFPYWILVQQTEAAAAVPLAVSPSPDPQAEEGSPCTPTPAPAPAPAPAPVPAPAPAPAEGSKLAAAPPAAPPSSPPASPPAEAAPESPRPAASTPATAPAASTSAAMACAAVAAIAPPESPASWISSAAESERRPGTQKLAFFSGNPSAEIMQGFLHLYREIDPPAGASPTGLRPPSASRCSPPSSAASAAAAASASAPTLPVPSPPPPPAPPLTHILCMLGVPSFMSPSELMGFLGAATKEISNVRIVRNAEKPEGRYTVLLRFRESGAIARFLAEFNGRPFSSLAPETCTVVPVASVEFVEERSGREEKPCLFPPPEGQQELPNCPVCLERLDEAAGGLLTVGCNHTFHCACLEKWKMDTTCPVCRYSQFSPESAPATACSVCGTNESLWMCLVCGHVGCGRYVNQHARQHYNATSHAYSLDLATRYVWDYAADRYAHRLVSSKDGQPVEIVPGSSKWPLPESLVAGDSIIQDKLNALALDYNILLEQQTAVYEERIAQIEAAKARRIHHLEDDYAELLAEKERFERRLKELSNEKRRREKQLAEFQRRVLDREKETAFLREVNKAFLHNKHEWEAREAKLREVHLQALAEKDALVAELQEQIRDLTFYIGAQEKLRDTDAKDGDVITVVPQQQPAAAAGAGAGAGASASASAGAGAGAGAGGRSRASSGGRGRRKR